MKDIILASDDHKHYGDLVLDGNLITIGILPKNEKIWIPMDGTMLILEYLGDEIISIEAVRIGKKHTLQEIQDLRPNTDLPLALATATMKIVEGKEELMRNAKFILKLIADARANESPNAQAGSQAA